MANTITVEKDTDDKYRIVKNDKEVLGKMKSKIEAMQNAISIAKENPNEIEVVIRRG